MSTQLDDDLRTAFAELAATTTITPDPRFGEITSPAPDQPPRRWVVLAAAAACIALVAGLAVVARDRTAETPAPADTDTVPLPTAIDTSEDFPAPDTDGPPHYLFPASGSSDYDSPEVALDAYLASRMSTAPKAVSATFAISENGGVQSEDSALLQFDLFVQSEDGCCDSANGMALLERHDDANGSTSGWYVATAGSAALVVDSVSYLDGTIRGSFTPAIGGLYRVEVSAVDGSIAQLEFGVEAADGRATDFVFDGVSGAAVAVRMWHGPTDAEPFAAAMFAEFVLTEDLTTAFDYQQLLVDAGVGSVEQSSSAVAPTGTLASTPEALGLSSVAASTPTESVEAYLDDRARSATVDEALTFAVDPLTVYVGGDAQALVRFSLSTSAGTSEGVASLYNTQAGGHSPAWSVMLAGTPSLVFRDTLLEDGNVTATLSSSEDASFELTANATANGIALSRARVDLGTIERRVAIDVGESTNAMSLRAWSATEEAQPAFGEVLANGGWLYVDFSSLLGDYEAARGDQVVVPPLVGMTESQARDRAVALGLPIDVTYVTVDAGDPTDGTIVSQSIEAGSTVPAGALLAVDVAVARVESGED